MTVNVAGDNDFWPFNISLTVYCTTTGGGSIRQSDQSLHCLLPPLPRFFLLLSPHRHGHILYCMYVSHRCPATHTNKAGQAVMNSGIDAGPGFHVEVQTNLTDSDGARA